MLERVEYGDIDIILFSEFSRLARNATELLEQIKLFIDKGINLYFDKQKLWVKDTNKDVGSLILLHVLAVMSSYEIELFVERSLSGKITKVQAGHGGGDERAYGYMHNENKQIVINPIESKIVARIFEMYVGGYSSIQISEILNAEKVPAPYVRKLNEYKKNREAKGLEVKEYKFDTDNLKWRISTINRLMHNELYKGNRRITFYKPDPTKSTSVIRKAR
ncbi:recombinase family protein [Bacteroides fragilis]